MIVARQLLDRVELLGDDVTGRMAAVVLADLSVEMAAKAAVVDQPLGGRASLRRIRPRQWFSTRWSSCGGTEKALKTTCPRPERLDGCMRYGTAFSMQV